MAAVQRVPASDRAGRPRQVEGQAGQTAEGEVVTRGRLALLAVLLTGLTALAANPLPHPAKPVRTATLPAAGLADLRTVGQWSGAEIPAAFAQEPAPAPRPGAEPPPPPRDAPPVAGSPASDGGQLSLDEVLASVERHYPLLRAIEQERAAAGGRLLSSLGAFDLNLNAGADGGPGTYDNFRSTAGVSQGLPVAGIGLFAGYRNGYGDFPTYNLGQKTADGGEFRAGITVPLWRDRAIDRPRATVQQARLDVELAEPVIERARLDFIRAAARVYWAWVAAGQRLKAVEGLLALAVERDTQIRRQVEEGAVANIARVDNQQNIALRNGVLVQAQRAFQQATIELSLFLRDETGTPTLAGPGRLPDFPEATPVDPASFDAALRTAFELRPEPRRLALQRERAAVELRLARNHTLPTLNATLAGSQDVGYGKSSLSGPNGLDRSGLTAGLLFQVPVQRSEARGRVLSAQAQVAQLDQQLRQARDVVRAEVQDAFSALERAYEFLLTTRQRVELARLVAQAEREQFRIGRSDVLRVTLREQATFDAEVVEIGARQDYFRALAELRVAMGVGGR
jgi:outer membrane protein TolC